MLTLRVWPSGDTYRFDRADYDPQTDRLRLTAGPPTAASAAFSPEGHILRIAEPVGYLCGVTLTRVSQRLHDEGAIELTLSPDEFVVLHLDDVAHLISESRLLHAIA